MNRILPPTVFTLILLLAIAGKAFATTYYIAATGSDSNNGTSNATPWLHAPGMKGCSASCGSASPKPGDQFILRGGDTWTPSSLPWVWSWAGSSGSNILIGVDQTWFTGASWTRPVITGLGTYPGASTAFFLNLGSESYVTVANLEFTGLNWTANLIGEDAYIAENGGTYVRIHDCYFHGWSHSAGVEENNDANALFTGSNSITNEFYNNVIDGSDTKKDSFGGIYGGGFGNVYQNYFAWLDNGMNTAYVQTLHDNTFVNTGVQTYPGGVSHWNVMESNTDAPGFVVYNNLFLHMNPNSSGGIGIQLAPQAGATTYFFNNVLADELIAGNQLMCGSALSNPGGSCTIFNNTEECGADASGPNQACLRMGSGWGTPPSGAQLMNNHVITSSSPIQIDGTCGSCTVAQNPNPQTKQTLPVANGQGYTLAETHAFSPTSSSGVTVGAGVDESSLCTTIGVINSAAGTACLSDTTYGVSYDSTNHTVSWPARTPVTRTPGAWDVGAYFYANSSAPKAPTGLAAVVQ